MVNELMEEFFPEILDVGFTADMEQQLDEIEEGKENWQKILDNFYAGFKDRLKVAEEKMEKVTIEDEVSEEICDKCGRPMVFKYGRYGKFLACSGFPECHNTKPIIKEIGVDLSPV